tara:strand:+ start:304 stop:1623 length:1320 start_codon:yes stop_codon:yes gene_type:complete
MKLDSIEINGYKGFRNVKIDFNSNLNILIGSNASGKTTILDAIGTIFHDFTRRFTGGGFGVPDLELSDYHINYDSKSILLKGQIIDFPNFDKNLVWNVEYGSQNFQQNNEFHNWFYNEIEKGIAKIHIVKYYPSNRGSNDYSEQNLYSGQHYRTPQLEAWSNLYQNNLTYSKFLHWFFDNENNELRLQKSKNDFTIESPRLRDVRAAIQKTFEILEFGNYNLSSKQVESRTNSKFMPTLVLSKNGTDKEIRLDGMSAGQKAIVTLIADIAYNLSIANNFKEHKKFLEAGGIVLIDEIETHLHPKWQREIVNILTQVFPNIQFFIATHSPQVISSVKSENIFVCDDFGIEKVNLKTKGEDTNSLLKYIFEASDRPKPYIELINEFNRLIENNSKYDAIEKVIKQIEELYNQDDASAISNLIDELNIKFAAYQFEQEYEKN